MIAFIYLIFLIGCGPKLCPTNNDMYLTMKNVVVKGDVEITMKQGQKVYACLARARPILIEFMVLGRNMYGQPYYMPQRRFIKPKSLGVARHLESQQVCMEQAKKACEEAFEGWLYDFFAQYPNASSNLDFSQRENIKCYIQKCKYCN